MLINGADLAEVREKLPAEVEAVEEEWRISIANAPAFILIDFGYLGSILFVGVAAFLVRKLCGPLNIMFIFLVSLLLLTYSAFYSPRTLVYVLALAGVNYVYRRDVGPDVRPA